MSQYSVYLFIGLIMAWVLWSRILGPKLAGVKSMDATAYFALRDEPHTLVDVRTGPEWAGGHPAKALHIPLGELSARIHEVPAGIPVVCICASGQRSAMAARMIARAGQSTVYNFSGGMGSWQSAGLPVSRG